MIIKKIKLLWTIDSLNNEINMLLELKKEKQLNNENLDRLIEALTYERDTLSKEIDDLMVTRDQLLADISMGENITSIKEEYEIVEGQLREIQQKYGALFNLKNLAEKYSKLEDLHNLDDEINKIELRINEKLRLLKETDALTCKTFLVDDIYFCLFYLQEFPENVGIDAFKYISYSITKDALVGVSSEKYVYYYPFAVYKPEINEREKRSSILVIRNCSCKDALMVMDMNGLDDKKYYNRKKLNYSEIYEILDIIYDNKNLFGLAYKDGNLKKLKRKK